MSLKSIDLKDSSRLLLIPAALVAVVFAVLTVKWAFANTLATRAEQREMAALSVGLGPNDPQTHYALAVLSERTFLPEDLQKAVEEYEQAAALAPSDFRLWLQLGKARERAGDAEGAEKALRRALVLAPNYAEVQWTLGNALLRQGRAGEAFALIRTAADADDRFVIPAISTSWDIFNGNIADIRANIGNSSKINAALASFLLRREKLDEAFETWSRLPAEEKVAAFRQNGEELYNYLLAAKKFHAALQIWNELAGDGRKVEIGRITDGGFENYEKQEKTSVFEWQTAEGLEPVIGVDNTAARSGNVSRRIIFDSADGKDFRSISQVVAVEPGAYEFEIFYKADLKTSSTMRWEVVDPSNGEILAQTEPIEKKSDWSLLRAAFNAPAETQAVIVRLVRNPCGAGICPIAGSVWFDDASINRK